MVKKLTAWMGVYEEEIQLFLWTMLLLFLVRTCGIILNNYAETAFLKRYGVEYMPVVNMINAIATVVVMGFVAGLMQKMPGPKLLTGMFLFCGFSVALIRALIPLGIDLIYPLLFMLKAQYEVLLALLFWNLANDLFNTQQSKRLFPLLSAGGVVGQILGSFGTPWFAETLRFDNLLLAYLAITLAGAVSVYMMAKRFPALLSGGGRKKKGPKQKATMIEEVRRIWPMMKESTLIKIMILLTLLPNIVIPIINYQFNYAVNDQFATEGGLIEFFGYFRGVLNIISLIILLFVGKIYGRWGLPVALMFHPCNYALAFLAFLLRFDVIAAMYARMSTQILRTTINIPAMAVVTGLFPESYRNIVRPFLRGTVVRIGLFFGSSLILISDKLFHPRYLSLVALPFVLGWIFAPFWLKRRYTDILTDLVSGDMSDLKSMDAKDIHQLFRDPSMRRKLREDFIASDPESCIWYGRMLKDISDEDLNRLVLEKLATADPDTRIQLMELLSAADAQALETLAAMTREPHPRLQVAAVATLSRLTPSDRRGEIDLSSLVSAPSPDVRAHAAAALLPTDPEHYRKTIQDWGADSDKDTRRAGVVAAGLSQDAVFLPMLSGLLDSESVPAVRAAVLDALAALKAPDLNARVEADLNHASPAVRAAALGAYQIVDKASLGRVIPMLADAAESVSHLAKTRILDAPFQDGKQLIKALSTPRRKVREEIFRILGELDIKDLDMVRFIRGQAEGAYKFFHEARTAARLEDCPERHLLEDHLLQQGQLQVENIVRVLAVQDGTETMRIISRGLLSSDARQQGNSQEALSDILDNSVARILLPLVDKSPMDQKLAAGKKFFKTAPFAGAGAEFIQHLLDQKFWVTRVMALEAARTCRVTGIDPDRIAAAAADPENQQVRLAARRLQRQLSIETHNEEAHMEDAMAISEKILLLKRIDIFEGLNISELSAIASVTEELDYLADARVIQEGDTGDTLYLVISGNTAVVKKLEDGTEIELDQIAAGDYFGEMALFEDTKRSASIVTLEPTRLLYLHKQDFNEMVREYPQIALAICTALSGRIRKLHQKMKA